MTETPMPIENYIAEQRVVSKGKTRCEIFFKSTYEVSSENKETLQNALNGFQNIFLTNLKKELK